MSPALLLLLSLSACKKNKPEDTTSGLTDSASTDLPWSDLAVDQEWTIDSLACDAEVLHTESDVPHIYAHDRLDLSRVHGFVQARDRYFSMELARRLGRGTVSELLGADALSTDMDSRASGMTHVGDHLLDVLTDDQAAILDAFAQGINAWIAAVKAGDLPVPSELAVAAPILGVSDPTDLLVDWDRGDLTAMAAVLIYELGYETGDVGRASTQASLDSLFQGEAGQDLRRAGVITDIWDQVVPVLPIASADGWGTDSATASLAPPATSTSTSTSPRARKGKPVPADMLARLSARLERFEQRLGRGDLEAGWGSNVWAVGASVSADGTAMLSSDGHLPLTVPSLFWQVGLDTQVLGGGDTHQVGLAIPGLPFMAVGTNGDVAWSQTQLMGDITDWYREELQLDQDGALSATLFQGDWQPVVAHQEDHTIADIPLLGSEGGTFSWTRYETFDGRFIADIEGTEVAEDYTPASGETVVVFPGSRILPGDTDGDGTITAISFDYTAFSDGNILSAVDAFGHA
ncbi:MAG: penicillin acylase family protein, partial [Oligoflexia bacterium]|nr:penicillin acylase family protein [Oligoflexia bacterium]